MVTEENCKGKEEGKKKKCGETKKRFSVSETNDSAGHIKLKIACSTSTSSINASKQESSDVDCSSESRTNSDANSSSQHGSIGNPSLSDLHDDARSSSDSHRVTQNNGHHKKSTNDLSGDNRHQGSNIGDTGGNDSNHSDNNGNTPSSSNSLNDSNKSHDDTANGNNYTSSSQNDTNSSQNAITKSQSSAMNNSQSNSPNHTSNSHSVINSNSHSDMNRQNDNIQNDSSNSQSVIHRQNDSSNCSQSGGSYNSSHFASSSDGTNSGSHPGNASGVSHEHEGDSGRHPGNNADTVRGKDGCDSGSNDESHSVSLAGMADGHAADTNSACSEEQLLSSVHADVMNGDSHQQEGTTDTSNNRPSYSGTMKSVPNTVGYCVLQQQASSVVATQAHDEQLQSATAAPQWHIQNGGGDNAEERRGDASSEDAKSANNSEEAAAVTQIKSSTCHSAAATSNMNTSFSSDLQEIDQADLAAILPDISAASTSCTFFNHEEEEADNEDESEEEIVAHMIGIASNNQSLSHLVPQSPSKRKKNLIPLKNIVPVAALQLAHPQHQQPPPQQQQQRQVRRRYSGPGESPDSGIHSVHDSPPHRQSSSPTPAPAAAPPLSDEASANNSEQGRVPMMHPVSASSSTCTPASNSGHMLGEPGSSNRTFSSARQCKCFSCVPPGLKRKPGRPPKHIVIDPNKPIRRPGRPPRPPGAPVATVPRIRSKQRFLLPNGQFRGRGRPPKWYKVDVSIQVDKMPLHKPRGRGRPSLKKSVSVGCQVDIEELMGNTHHQQEESGEMEREEDKVEVAEMCVQTDSTDFDGIPNSLPPKNNKNSLQPEALDDSANGVSDDDSDEEWQPASPRSKSNHSSTCLKSQPKLACEKIMMWRSFPPRSLESLGGEHQPPQPIYPSENSEGNGDIDTNVQGLLMPVTKCSKNKSSFEKRTKRQAQNGRPKVSRNQGRPESRLQETVSDDEEISTRCMREFSKICDNLSPSAGTVSSSDSGVAVSESVGQASPGRKPDRQQRLQHYQKSRKKLLKRLFKMRRKNIVDPVFLDDLEELCSEISGMKLVIQGKQTAESLGFVKGNMPLPSMFKLPGLSPDVIVAMNNGLELNNAKSSTTFPSGTSSSSNSDLSFNSSSKYFSPFLQRHLLHPHPRNGQS